MATVKLRRIPPAPPRFPAAPAAPPSEEPAVPDESHMVRRRASSAPAHEVQMEDFEILSLHPVLQEGAAGARAAIAAPLPRPAPVNASPRPKARVGRAALLAGVGVVLLAGGFDLGLFAHRPRNALPARTTPAWKIVVPAPPPAAPIPEVPVTSLPRAPDGTVVGSAGHRLWIDGKLADDWKALVPCGQHTVQVGSAGTLRKVDVPCGDEIVVPP